MDLPPGVQRLREFAPLVFESSGYVAKLARRYFTEWAGKGGRREGREEGESIASTRNLSSAVHDWNAAATILYLRDALSVQLPFVN